MSDPTEDGIARLLREAGPRPAVTAERESRVKDHVRAQWRRARRRRARAFGLLAAAATIVLALAVWMGVRRGGPAAPVAVVERGAASAGDALTRDLPRGAVLATSAGERLAIRTASRHSVRLDVETRIRLVSGRTIALEAGSVYVDSGSPSPMPEAALEIDTPFGRIAEVGTQYAARVTEEALEVRVREGRIALAASGDVGELTVEAGHGFRVARAGAEALGPEPASGPGWDWVQEAAPPMVIEGRSLSEFLEWYARERGVSVRFASADARAGAAATVLRGSIEGMSPDEALSSVLATSGVRAARSGSELLVEGR
jgi:ferric-dicitrate binding protein FerR (iron transport regulator)